VSLRFTDDDTLTRALTALRHGFLDPADDDRLTLQIPSDGDVASLRDLLTQLDTAGIEPAHLAVHTPDLDDVFLTLTGQHTHTTRTDTTHTDDKQKQEIAR
jgi:ABC-2 type transport system ATP-binding protein